MKKKTGRDPQPSSLVFGTKNSHHAHTWHHLPQNTLQTARCLSVWSDTWDDLLLYSPGSKTATLCVNSRNTKAICSSKWLNWPPVFLGSAAQSSSRSVDRGQPRSVFSPPSALTTALISARPTALTAPSCWQLPVYICVCQP